MAPETLETIKLACITASFVVAFMRGSEWLIARTRGARARRDVLAERKARAADTLAAVALVERRIHGRLDRLTAETARASSQSLSAWGLVAGLRGEVLTDLEILRRLCEGRATDVGGFAPAASLSEPAERPRVPDVSEASRPAPESTSRIASVVRLSGVVRAAGMGGAWGRDEDAGELHGGEVSRCSSGPSALVFVAGGEELPRERMTGPLRPPPEDEEPTPGAVFRSTLPAPAIVATIAGSPESRRSSTPPAPAFS